MTLYIDVSHHDRDRRGSPLDWARIARDTGQGTVMVARASYGDPAGYNPTTRFFAEHQAEARDAGYTCRGGYANLVHGDAASIARQVDYLRRELDATGCVWGMCDVEPYAALRENGLWPRWDDALRFRDRWAAVETRVMAWYIARWVWSGWLGQPDLRQLPGPLVNAHYPPANPPDTPGRMYQAAGGDDGPGWQSYGGRSPDMWQYTSVCSLAGASSRTDLDAYRGSVTELVSLLGGDMTYPVRAVTRPAALSGLSNGRLPASVLLDTPGQAGGPTVRLVAPAARAWRAMCAAAKTAGHTLKATSLYDSYRPYEVQERIFRERYTTTPLAGRPTKTWQGQTWWLKSGYATAATPGSCVEGEAVVVTRRGLLPIKEVHVGDEVWTHEYRWRPVIDVRAYERSVIRVTGSGHPGIDVTSEHRWWVYDGWHRILPIRKGIRYAGTDIKVKATTELLGDLWLSPERVTGVDAPDYATTEWATWAGAWVADGSLHYVHDVLTEGLVYPRNAKADQIQRWAHDAGVGLTENTDRGDGTRRFRFGRPEAHRLEAEFGRFSTVRTVPVWLLANSQKYGEPFLRGFLHGDGHWAMSARKVPHWSFSTSSRQLAVGLRLLAQSLGWHAYLSDRRWAAPSIVKGRPCVPTAETWAITMYEQKPPAGTRLWNHEGFVVGRVRRLVDRDEIRAVYDLTVADDESFCVDGLFTHNSNHGWGLAVDTGEERDGDTGTESLDTGTLEWLRLNAVRFGFSWEI